ncbi:MAG: hypothetical protein HC828_06830 [Blastochloris sp.]|nr:hypothetical protein [Blastochloris sp.]
MTQPTERRLRKGWRGRQARPRRQGAVVWSADPPRMELDIYDDLIVRRTRMGTCWRSDLISPQALAQVCAGLPHATGLLPAHMLGMGWTSSGMPYYVQYLPPRRICLMTPDQTYPIPIPPLVVGGCGHDYQLWALDVTTYPTTVDLPLWVAPFPNYYHDGTICWGSVESRPVATPTTLAAAARLFLEESYFNAHGANGKSIAYPVSVLARWQDLVVRQVETYPLDDLFPAERSLGWLLAGGPWGGGS